MSGNSESDSSQDQDSSFNYINLRTKVIEKSTSSQYKQKTLHLDNKSGSKEDVSKITVEKEEIPSVSNSNNNPNFEIKPVVSDCVNMTSLDPKLVLKLVPNFSGNTRELHKFISCSELIYKSLKETEIPKFLELVKLKLDGKAYDLIKYNELKTWKELKDILTSEFTETRSIGHLQLELATLRQQRGEDVRTYANRLEAILHSLNESCIVSEGVNAAQTIKKLNEHIALKSFQEGLNESIKIIVKACRFTNLSEAINRATEEEMVVKHFSTLTITERPKSSNLPIKYCHICNKRGHLDGECFKRLRSTSPSRTSIQHIRVIRCAYCKKNGHHIQECFSKKRSDARREQASTQPNSSMKPTNSYSGNDGGQLKINRGTPSRVQDP